jgi:hypothetical protein
MAKRLDTSREIPIRNTHTHKGGIGAAGENGGGAEGAAAADAAAAAAAR